MQRAREGSRNTYKFYSHDMNHRAFTRMMMENSLRLALRREEFCLHYQPQIDLCTGRISGLEAVVRWNRPGFGIVYPKDFIHLMEDTGLIVDFGDWALKNACAQKKVPGKRLKTGARGCESFGAPVSPSRYREKCQRCTGRSRSRSRLS